MAGPTQPRSPSGERFRVFAARAAEYLGTPRSFLAAVLLVLVWLVTGPAFHFSNGWQLVINTGTTVVTFLMVFVIQTTQNRDARAIHLKLDELIRSSKARDVFADLEDATEEELAAFQREFRKLRVKGDDDAEPPRGPRIR
ncbi:MAG TPA: low affinity iron permease family protein [Polyangia bacterium]|nr:low affinity iron permease family protein [Polyangia bacterium]